MFDLHSRYRIVFGLWEPQQRYTTVGKLASIHRDPDASATPSATNRPTPPDLLPRRVLGRAVTDFHVTVPTNGALQVHKVRTAFPLLCARREWRRLPFAIEPIRTT